MEEKDEVHREQLDLKIMICDDSSSIVWATREAGVKEKKEVHIKHDQYDQYIYMTMLRYPVGIGATEKAAVRLARLAESTSIRLTDFPVVST